MFLIIIIFLLTYFYNHLQWNKLYVYLKMSLVKIWDIIYHFNLVFPYKLFIISQVELTNF